MEELKQLFQSVVTRKLSLFDDVIKEIGKNEEPNKLVDGMVQVKLR